MLIMLSRQLTGFFTLIYIGILTSIYLCLAVLKHVFGVSNVEKRKRDGSTKKTIALTHPAAIAGGSERVFWTALRALQQNLPRESYQFIIYTGNLTSTEEELFAKPRVTFNILVDPSNVKFIRLQRQRWADTNFYPIFTLVGEALGSVYMGLEALTKFTPDVYIDVTGFHFTFPVFKYFGGCRVGAYVHFPVVTTDMLTNGLYYRLFARIYRWAGRCSDVIMVNGSWTEGNVLQLWGKKGNILKVYPPCDTQELLKLQRKDKDGLINLISVSLFRAEKDHPLQIAAVKELKGILDPELWTRVRLVWLGSVRNDEDQKRVNDLKELAKILGVKQNLVVNTNFSFTTMKDEFSRALIGMHSMKEEHFGISVVECMAAGLLMVAHKSGGPLMDIVTEYPEHERTGFLAETPQEYAEQIKRIFELRDYRQKEIWERARKSVDRFSDEQFAKSFI